MNSILGSTKDKALKLLGQGIPAINVAQALGCEPSYISQLMADDQFSAAVQELRYKSLSNATDRDERLNMLEDKLINKVNQDIDNNPLAFRSTMDRVRALSMINGMKRRGANSDAQISGHTTIVNLTLPTQVINKFTKENLNEIQLDINNQVVKVGNQDLITMQSGTLTNILGETKNETANAITSKFA